jgi:hypothetical protein
VGGGMQMEGSIRCVVHCYPGFWARRMLSLCCGLVELGIPRPAYLLSVLQETLMDSCFALVLSCITDRCPASCLSFLLSLFHLTPAAKLSELQDQVGSSCQRIIDANAAFDSAELRTFADVSETIRLDILPAGHEGRKHLGGAGKGGCLVHAGRVHNCL